MPEEAVTVASAAPSLAASFVDRPPLPETAPFIKPPSHVIHLGRPDHEEPHKSMTRCDKLHAEHPEMRLLIIVWDEKDVEELKPKINPEKAELYHWKDDGELTTMLLDRLPQIVGAQIVGPRWYVCTEKHISEGTYNKLRDKCQECGNAVAIVEPYLDKAKQFYDIFLKVIKLINFDTSSGEFLYQAVNPMTNLLRNMPYALGHPSFPALECKHLKGSGKSKPAIICGAGPSLEDALPHLKRLQDRCVIICVGRSFKILHAAGIRVDYTVSVEMFDFDAAIFDGVTPEMAAGTVLCYASVASNAMVRNWPGKSVCLWDIQTAQALGRDDYILGGNSVSHHMLNFAAQILDCSPVVMVGIDLSYTKPKTHAAGTTPENWPKEVKEKEDAYQAEDWLPCTGKGDNFHPECHRVPAIVGGVISPQILVRSSPAYQNFATLFTCLIAKHRRTVYNACPNGLKIEGTQYLDLANVVDFKEVA